MAQRGDDAGGGDMESILERYEARLTRYAARITGDSDLARDVVQEVFLRLAKEAAVRSNGHLAPWLFTVCRRQALDEVRKRRTIRGASAGDRSQPAEAEVDPADRFDPAAAAERRDATAMALKAVAALPPREQEVIRLRFQEGLSYKEIAAVTGRTVNHVGVLIHNAIKTIRKELNA